MSPLTKIHGLDVRGYHIFNLAIHIINALLVYWLVLLTFKTPFFAGNSSRFTNLIALFSALLFVSHPVQTQAVTYIVQRFASLATLFYLLSLVMYVRWRLSIIHSSRFTVHGLYLISILSAIFAMKTKEIAFTLPVIIVLYEFCFFTLNAQRQSGIKHYASQSLYLLPFLLTMLIIPLTLIGGEKPLGELISDVSKATRLDTTISISRWDYLFTQFRVIVTYIRLLFLPINQNLDYDYPIYHSFSDPNVFLSFLFLLSIFGLGVYLYFSRHSSLVTRLVSFGIFWFFITLSVESSVIPIPDVIFEHRVYLPSVGVVIAFSTAVFYVLHFPKTHLSSVVTLLSTVVLVLSIAAYQRNAVWQDELSLWNDVVRKSPKNLRAYHNLGVAYSHANQHKKALETYEKAIAINPDFLILQNAYNSRGVAYLYTGNYEKALEDFNIAAQVTPYDDYVFYNRGVAYTFLGNMNKALQDFKKSCDLGNRRGCEEIRE